MKNDAVRRLISKVITSLCAFAVLVALVPLALILFLVITQGILSLSLDFFFNMPAPVGEPGGGMANAIVGTLILIGLGAAFAIPIGVISGIYAAEFSGTKMATAVQFAADTLNGVPSIVIGVFVYGSRRAAREAVQRGRGWPCPRRDDASDYHEDDGRIAEARPDLVA